MWLNRVLSLKRINCVDSSTLFGSFNSSYAVKTQDLPEQIEGDLEASLCFGGTNNKVQVCAFFAWNLMVFLKQVWRPIGRFWHHFVSAVQTTTCKCVHSSREIWSCFWSRSEGRSGDSVLHFLSILRCQVRWCYTAQIALKLRRYKDNDSR